MSNAFSQFDKVSIDVGKKSLILRFPNKNMYIYANFTWNRAGIDEFKKSLIATFSIFEKRCFEEIDYRLTIMRSS